MTVEGPMNRIDKPQPGEYAPYAIQYIGLLPDDGLVLRHLRDNLRATRELILSLPEEAFLFRYAPGKWTIKEILVHISDDERINSDRAWRLPETIGTELPGFEQDHYTRYSGAERARCPRHPPGAGGGARGDDLSVQELR